MSGFIWFLDFHYLWAAGAVALNGGNPYDVGQYREALLGIGLPADDRLPPFPHPPWMLFLYVIFALAPFPVAAAIWCLIQILGFAFIGYYYLPTARVNFNAHFFSLLCFPAVLNSLVMGQVALLVLLTIIFSEYLFAKRKFIASGLAVSLALFKPHLIWLWLAWGCIRAISANVRSDKVSPRDHPLYWCLGLCIGIVILLGSSYAVFPVPTHSWMSSLRKLASEHAQSIDSVTLLSILPRGNWRNLFAPILSVVALGLFLWLIRRDLLKPNVEVKSLKNSQLALGLALFFTPYAWVHDQLILLPTFLLAIQQLKSNFSERMVLALNFGLAIIAIIFTARPSFSPYALVIVGILVFLVVCNPIPCPEIYRYNNKNER